MKNLLLFIISFNILLLLSTVFNTDWITDGFFLNPLCFQFHSFQYFENPKKRN